MIDYIPSKTIRPDKVLFAPSAWVGLESIIKDILDTFNIQKESAIDFGVDMGYSTVAISNFFKTVTGIDHFKGDHHAGLKEGGFYEFVLDMLKPYENIKLINDSFEGFIKTNNDHYNLAHIDIVHDYQPTYDCGAWCCEHADIVLFHDTESYLEVKKAVDDLSKKYELKFYNYDKCYGLGILVK